MVPASLARAAHESPKRVDDLGIRDRWWRPANIPIAVRAQLRTLVVS